MHARMEEIRHRHRAIYEANAARWDAERARTLVERRWLDKLLAHVQQGGSVLDLGCGAGEPIAAYLIGQGCAVTGVDFAPAMLSMARARFPQGHWIEADMRALDLGERFHGIVAWNSFFHLSRDEQRAVIPRLARHLLPGGPLLVTVGPRDDEVLGQVADETVYHASLDLGAYGAHLARSGLGIEAFVAEDPGCGGHSVLLAVAAVGG